MLVPNIQESSPKTIEELKEYCESNGFTSEKTRFFVGENYKEPRAFGIYKDEASGEFIVYKNKDDGNRAIRDRGADEAYAVGELYDRLQKEIINQKQHYYAGDIPNRSISGKGKKNPYLNMEVSEICSDNTGKRFSRKFSRFMEKLDRYILKFAFLIVIVMIFLFLFCDKNGSSSGSNRNGSDNYYYNNYDNNSYDSWGSGSDSWGSDSWGSDSWDSGYTDWGSDW